jgi:hypothetical protein
MAAAWPYCDAVVSAHNFAALGELLEALRAPRVHRPSYVPPSPSGAAGAPGADAGAAPGAGPAPSALSLPITQNLGQRWSPGRA